MNVTLCLALSMVASWAAAVAHHRAAALATFPAADPMPGVAAVLGAFAAVLVHPAGAAVRALAAAVEAWAVATVDASPAGVDADNNELVTTARDVRAVLLDVANDLDTPRPADGFPLPPPADTTCGACGERERMPLCAVCLGVALAEREEEDERAENTDDDRDPA